MNIAGPNPISLLLGLVTFVAALAITAVMLPFLDTFITDMFTAGGQLEVGARLSLYIFFITADIVVPIITVMGLEGVEIR